MSATARVVAEPVSAAVWGVVAPRPVGRPGEVGRPGSVGPWALPRVASGGASASVWVPLVASPDPADAAAGLVWVEERAAEALGWPLVELWGEVVPPEPSASALLFAPHRRPCKRMRRQH